MVHHTTTEKCDGKLVRKTHDGLEVGVTKLMDAQPAPKDSA